MNAVFDIQRYGFAKLKGDFRSFMLEAGANGQVRFINPRCLAVSFIVPNPNPALAQRGDPPRGAWLFHTVFIDLDTGLPLFARNWWTASPDSRLDPLDDGEFLISGDGLAAGYDAGGRELWRLKLPATNAWRGRPYGTLLSSATGRTVGVVADIDRQSEIVEAVKATDGSREAAISVRTEAGPFRAFALSDDSIAYKMDNLANAQLLVKRLDGSDGFAWTCHGTECVIDFCFVGADRLLIATEEHALTELDRDGVLLAERPFGKESVKGIKPSFAGARILALLEEMRNPRGWSDSFPKAVSARLAVLDSKTLEEVASVQLDPKRHRLRSYAISADGSAIAFLEDEALHVVSVPGIREQGRASQH